MCSLSHLIYDRTSKLVVAVLFVLLGYSGPQAFAQAEKVTEVKDSVAVVNSFSLTEISSQAERTSLELKKKRAQIIDYETARKIRKEVVEFRVRYEEMNFRSDSTHLKRLTQNGLRDLRIKWMRLEEKLESWQNDLSGQTEELEGSLAELSEMKERWVLTKKAALVDSLPVAIIERIDAEIIMVEEVRKAASDTISTYIVGMDKIVQVLLDVRDNIESIRKVEERTWSDLFKKDNAAFWEDGLSVGDPNVVDSFGKSYNEVFDEAKIFLAERNEKVWSQIGLFLVLLVLTSYIFIRSGRMNEEARAQLGAVSKIARKPVSSALFIALITFPIMYKNPPVLIEELFIFLLMIPLVMIVPALIDRSMRFPFFIMVGLFVLDQFQIMNAQVLSTQRALLLAENLIGIGGLLWFFRPNSKASKVDLSRMGKTAFGLISTIAIFLTISLLANAVGRVTLSRVLTIAITQSAMAGLFLYAGVQVMEGILIFLMKFSPLKDLHIFLKYSDKIVKHTVRIVRALAFFWWLTIFLEHFALWEPIWNWCVDTFTKEWGYGTTSMSIWNILQFFLVLSVSILVAGFLRVLLEEEILVRFKLSKGLPMSIAFVVKYTVMVCGFFLAVGAAGIDLDKFAFVFGALGVGIGFGLQSLVANFISGIILVFERPIHVDDVVELGQGGLQGTVTQIGVRASKVRTWDGAEVIVPNGDLITKQVTNWTLSDEQRRREVKISTALNADPDQVIDIMRKVASLHPDVISVPEPAAYFQGYTENTLDFRLLFWVTKNLLGSSSDVALGVYRDLKDAGIEVPIQRRVVQIKGKVEDQPPLPPQTSPEVSE